MGWDGSLWGLGSASSLVMIGCNFSAPGVGTPHPWENIKHSIHGRLFVSNESSLDGIGGRCLQIRQKEVERIEMGTPPWSNDQSKITANWRQGNGG